MRRLRVALAVAFVASAAALTAAGGPAGAATSALSPSLTIRRVDTTAFPVVRVDAQLISSGSSQFTITDNGSEVAGVKTQSLAQSGLPLGTVLVIDTSATMADQNKMAGVKAAALRYVAQKLPGELIAIVATGASPRVVTNFTADAAQLDSQINALGPEGEQAMYDGVNAASSLLVDRPELLGNIIVISDRSDTLSRITAGQAQASAGTSKAEVFTVGLVGGNGLDPSILRALAINGGQYIAAPLASDMSAAMQTIQHAIQSGTSLTFQSKPNATSLDLVVKAAGLQATAHTVPGAVAAGSNVNPDPVHLRQAPGPLKGKIGELFIAILALIGAGLLGYAILALATTERSTLVTALKPYDEGGVSRDEDESSGSLIQSAIVARAVETTARFADEQGILDRVETMLDQADIKLRPPEALFFYLVGVVIITVAAALLTSLIVAFLVFVVIALSPPATLSFLATRRVKKFNTQLPDTLQLLSSSLRAGFSFMQGVEAVSNEAPNPMGQELRRVVIEARLGRPLEDALDECAARMHSPDFDWAVMAVKIQREVGGNLAELLQTVSETMVERERLRRDVKSLTAEGRMSAIVLGIMPPALGVVFYISNPTYMKVLFTHLGGQIALAVATVAMIAGFLWMKKIVDIEV